MSNSSKLWDSLRSSFWFLPAVMVLVTLLLAIALIALDRSTQLEGVTVLGALVPKGTASAGTLLSAIATSILTVTGSVFSIAIVAIQLASGQFGPRMLRDFMQDRGNQITFGTCCATFTYAVVVLWAIEDSKDLSFTPQVSVFVALLLTVATTCVLVYFLHHIAELVHADNLIARVGRDLESSIDQVFSAPLAAKPPARHIQEIPADFTKQAIALRAQHSGYIQKINYQQLLELAERLNLTIKLLHRPGQFVVKNDICAYAQSTRATADNSAANNRTVENRTAESKAIDLKAIDLEAIDLEAVDLDTLSEQISKTFSCGNQRKPKHDVEFPIKQLVETAIRAISPAVNDPFTAIRCIDRLSALLCYALQKPEQSACLTDSTGTLRLIIQPVTFKHLVNSAFDQIRQYGQTDVAVTLRLLESIETIAKQTRTEKEKMVLRRQADMIERGSQDPQYIFEQNDRQEILQQYNKAIQALS